MYLSVLHMAEERPPFMDHITCQNQGVIQCWKLSTVHSAFVTCPASFLWPPAPTVSKPMPLPAVTLSVNTSQLSHLLSNILNSPPNVSPGLIALPLFQWTPVKISVWVIPLCTIKTELWKRSQSTHSAAFLAFGIHTKKLHPFHCLYCP